MLLTAGPTAFVVFGILHFLGASILLYAALRPLIDRWYNRRSLYLEKGIDLEGTAFSPELTQLVCGAFLELTPMHDFLMEVWRSCPHENR